jgi:hypothetical protein
MEGAESPQAAPLLVAGFRDWTEWLTMSNVFKPPFPAHGFCAKIILILRYCKNEHVII